MRRRVQALKAARLASEAYAHARIQDAFRAKDLPALILALDIWATRAPPRTPQATYDLDTAIAAIGATQYGPATIAPAKAWAEARHAYIRIRREALNNAHRQTHRALPPLNP